MNEQPHTPVLLKETLEFLIVKRSGIYFDATLGFGGHTAAILKKIDENGSIIAVEVDDKAFEFSKKKFNNEKRVKPYKLNFTKIDVIAKIESIKKFDGILADLGVSSYQLDDVKAGFTYRQEAPLDLRMDKTLTMTGTDVVNSFSEEDLIKIFYDYGEEKNARKIAREIIKKRKTLKIKTTTELVKIIEDISPQRYLRKTLSRVFQALRIYVNDELGNLKKFLTKAVDLLSHKGRIVIISYHSLEDRIVKEMFNYEALDCICPPEYPVCKCNKEPRLKILTKKPATPETEEIQLNKRARSAKLRAGEKI